MKERKKERETENKKEKKKRGKEKKNKRQKIRNFLLATILLSENDRTIYDDISPFVSIRFYVRIFLSSSRPLRYHFSKCD